MLVFWFIREHADDATVDDENARHERINHSINEHISGGVYTNGVEKRMESPQAGGNRFASQGQREAS